MKPQFSYSSNYGYPVIQGRCKSHSGIQIDYIPFVDEAELLSLFSNIPNLKPYIDLDQDLDYYLSISG
ncbi:hypothetical protein [Pedobacter cryoconitis]|uniref:Uncharacterized protein n=1 Tax=Pedobacter cryoconitis TaxID=188932 RepID=A0A7X0J7U2_9SPHI|nr:hypothetical protein [Pedobacter cryoconitis]MBB6501907.1 hypothetical protein [Pedobacter cryoconitis]